MIGTPITRKHPAYDLVTEFLEHEVGRVHGGPIPVLDESVWIFEEDDGTAYMEFDIFLPGLPLNEARDEVLTRTRRIPLTPGHRVLDAIAEGRES